MRFFIESTEFGRVIAFRGEVRLSDLQRLQLDRLDRALLDGVATTPHDCLQTLEMLFRRHHEQQATPTVPPAG